jgi:hypothetical protein
MLLRSVYVKRLIFAYSASITLTTAMVLKAWQADCRAL